MWPAAGEPTRAHAEEFLAHIRRQLRQCRLVDHDEDGRAGVGSFVDVLGDLIEFHGDLRPVYGHVPVDHPLLKRSVELAPVRGRGLRAERPYPAGVGRTDRPDLQSLQVGERGDRRLRSEVVG